MLYKKRQHSLTVNQIIVSAAIYCWNATLGQSTSSCPRDEMDQIPYFHRIHANNLERGFVEHLADSAI
jgi:hypothetical protein